ncbi:extracellular solute-binding protein [Yoonia sediminilitoris]|uniref:Putative spermidine/putrescine transport system substrate-binding protein n=1 Tax=Yoonia sediminilitoris TaxID=1286148 RepID=A0A2T6KMQ3_9RHOB|nr:extracellular solute-binding protein [Yoonia sediminilitoris]PUB17461.1 putative spermidine/putrescine transport system substrate-binding protein [Yoonia sediminilitoris]RCW97756.1 putative spermidine/putrescine transport system substrate-binding protein [Yoonia sediminilitoris]
MTYKTARALTRRTLLKTSAMATVGTLAAPSILRAQSSELVIGCAGSHTAWMETIVAPHMKETIGADILFEGTKSSVNLEKMSSNKDAPYLSVVQMDDPVMIQAVEADLLTPITPDAVPNMTDLRTDATHMDGMWCNYVQPWAGIAYNTDKTDGVASWSALWEPANAGQIIIPSLQNTEGMWTLMSAAMLGSGLPFSEAQYEIDAAFAKLEELKPNLLTVYSTMSQAFNLLEQGEISMLSGNFSSYTLPRKAEGVPVDLAAPAEGIFAMPSGICLVKGGPNPELAQAYVNEMLGPVMQAAIADFASSVPANTTVTAGAVVPEGVQIYAPDWAFVASNRAEWIDRFDKLMAL